MQQPRAINEAKGILATLGVVFLLTLLWNRLLGALSGGLILFVLYFFRDPDRFAPNEDTLAVAPADGKIVAIEEREGVEGLEGSVVCISIFLSVLDVHVNRSPIAGRVTHSEGRVGLYLDARDPECARKNASRLWIVQGTKFTVAVRQITGAIARRIVPWSKVGDELTQGQKFGMIRFGSRTELYVPAGSQVLVQLGDAVRGGVTPMAKLPNAPAAS